MPSLTQTQIDSANQVDLAEFLSSRGIQLRKQSGQYVWDDQNVWIHGNEWYSHYEQTGGHPVGFVMKYFDRTFVEAVNLLNGVGQVSFNPLLRSDDMSPKLILPEKNGHTCWASI